MDSQLTSIASIVGFVLPNAIAAINRQRWGSTVKSLMAFAICVAAALATAWFDDKLNPADIRNTIIVVFVAAIGSYHLYWKNSGITDAIEKHTG